MIRPIRPQISRRGFLQASAAAGLAATMPTGTRAATPRRGGTMRFGIAHGQTTDTTDPATFATLFDSSLSFGMNGYLTQVGTDGTLEPELAESWEASPDATTWRFRIRKGVTFHNGRTLTVEDVIASINYHRGEKTTSAAKPVVAQITDIRADGPDTVVFELDGGNADFPYTLTDYHLPILPAKDDSIDWRSGIGCGAYRLVEFDPGVIARLERNEDFWRDDRGWFDEIEMLSLVDPNARTSALTSGSVDAIDRPDLKTVGLLARRPGIEIASVAGPQHYTFVSDCRESPYSDVNVRLALKYGIDRQEMVDKILFGHGTLGNDHPIGRGLRYYNADLEQREYDPDRARHHLGKAGLDGVSVSLSAADAAFPGAVDAAVLYQSSAGKAGIDIEVNRVPNDGYWSDVWLKHDFCAVYWAGRVTEDQMFSLAYKSGVSWNDAFWSNERFDKLLVEARSELDEDRRREMYHEMQALVRDDGGTVIPMFANFVFAMTDQVKHGELASNFALDGARWMERWWFA